MSQLVLIFLCTCVGVHSFALPFEGLWGLDIIHYNDFHARFEETSVNTPTCRSNNTSCLGGFPRLYQEIHTLLRQKPKALLLNAGDSFQGTYWYTLLKWNITQEFMNLLPHDAHAIGNHEFDDGPSGLAPYLRALNAPVLAANMDTTKEPILQGLYKPFVIVERNGRKVGIIGLITVDTKILSLAGKVEFTDPRVAMKKYAKELTDNGIDIIVVLSHCGLDVDIELARDYGDNVDIIIGGHTHSLMWNGPAPSGENVDAPYPLSVETNQARKHKVLIVQASAFTKYMGNLTVFFDFRGNYVKWEGGPIFLDRSIPEDESIKKQLAPYAELVHTAENVKIGESVKTLSNDDCVFGECAIGNLMTDAFNQYAKTAVQSDLDFIAIIQRGDIASSIPAGDITKGTIFELLPYLHRVESFQLPGAQVWEALERSVSSAWALKPFKGPFVLQVSGIRVTYDMSKPEGQRLTSVFLDKSEPEPLVLDKLYQVTAPAYLADGGDGFKMLTEDKQNTKDIGRDQNIVEDYITKNSPLDIKTDGRIVIMNN